MDGLEPLADTVAGICLDMKRKYDLSPSNTKKKATRAKKMTLLMKLHPDKINMFPALVPQFTEATKKINDILVDF
jgi:hypothetical protein